MSNTPKKRPKTFREPQTASSFGVEYEDTNGMCRLGDETCSHNQSVFEVPVRIIREKDYKALLRASRKGAKG